MTTGYGLEVPMDFSFYGDDRAIKWAQKHISPIKADKDTIVRNIMK